MRLGRANEKAFYAGREALLERGSIITQPGIGRPRYKVAHVRGSTVTVIVLHPWWVRLWNRIRRGAPPRRSEAVGRQLAGDRIKAK